MSIGADGLMYDDEGRPLDNPNPTRFQNKAYRDRLTESGGVTWNLQDGRYTPMTGRTPFARGRGERGVDIDAIERKLAEDDARTTNETMRGNFNTYQSSIDPNRDFKPVEGAEPGNYTYEGLPVRQGSDGAWYYDAGTMAQTMGFDEGITNKLQADEWVNPAWQYQNPNNQSVQGRTGVNPTTYFGGDFAKDERGQFLRNMARTPVVLGSGLNLSDERHINNIMRGNVTVDKVGRHGAWDPTAYNKNLYHKKDVDDKWYNAGNLVPMLTMGGMALMGGLAGGALFAPAGASVGGVSGAGMGLGGLAKGSLASSLAMGAGAGAGGSMPSSFFQGVQGDIGGALKNVGMGAAMGAGVAGVGHGLKAGFGALTSGGGSTQPSGYIDPVEFGQSSSFQGDPTIFGSARPFTDPANASIFVDPTVLGGTNAAGAIEALGDMYGGLDTSNYGLEMPEFGEGTIFDKGNNNIFDPEYGWEKSDLGVDPAASNMPYKQLADAALGLYSPDQMTTPIDTGMRNDMFTPSWERDLGLAPMTSGRQAVGAGQQYAGSNMSDEFSQQFQAVRPVQENYAQDIMSMIQESPEMLENPMVMNMVMEQLQGGGPMRRPIMPDETMVGAGLAV